MLEIERANSTGGKRKALSYVEIVLSCPDGKHRTVLPFSLFQLYGEKFTTIICDTCMKPFGLNIYAGVPFLDPQGHPQVLSLEIREVIQRGEVERSL